MAVINEDFHRCECGSATFEEKKVVSLPQGIRQRHEHERDIKIRTLDETTHYICTECGKHFD